MTIGCQFSLYPMTDRFTQIVVNIISDLKMRRDIQITSDDLSTMLIGPSETIFSLIASCFLKASKRTDHVVVNVTFSRGCPGEPDDSCCTPTDTLQKLPFSKSKTSLKRLNDMPVSAQFALYPMGNKNYMDVIYQEIEGTKKIVSTTPKHFCTRLDGDIKDVFTALKNSFDHAGESTSHVVLTATISNAESREI